MTADETRATEAVRAAAQAAKTAAVSLAGAPDSAVDAALKPEAHHVRDCLPHLLITPVQVGLLDEE